MDAIIRILWQLGPCKSVFRFVAHSNHNTVAASRVCLAIRSGQFSHMSIAAGWILLYTKKESPGEYLLLKIMKITSWCLGNLERFMQHAAGSRNAHALIKKLLGSLCRYTCQQPRALSYKTLYSH
jgi:hypothetical protein